MLSLLVADSCDSLSLGLPDITTDFRARAVPLSEVVNDSEDFIVQIEANRAFVLEGIDCEWPLDENFELGQECKLSHEGYYRLTFPSVAVDKDHQGQLTLVLYDSPTGQTLSLEVPYCAYAHRVVSPSGIILSRGSLSVNLYDSAAVSSGEDYQVESFQVSMLPLDSETGFLIEQTPSSTGAVQLSISASGPWDASCTLESNSGVVYVRGIDRSGAVHLKVSATADGDVYTYVDVYVRHRVALVLSGEFQNIFYVPCAHSHSNETGWYGIPLSIRSSLMEWTITDTGKGSIEEFSPEDIDGLQLHQLLGCEGSYSFSSTLRIAPGRRECNLCYGPNCGSSKRLIINMQHDEDNVNAVLPDNTETYFLCENLSNTEVSYLEEVRQTLAYYNDYADWVGYWWWLNVQLYTHTTGWTDFSYSIDSVTFDEDRLDLRYFLYMFSARYSSGNYCGPDTYWWSSCDHTPWIQKVK